MSDGIVAAPHIALLGAANSIHLQRWALALAARGRRVSLITQHAREALPLPAAIELVPLPWRGPLAYALNARALRRWLARERPALLHAHYASGYGTLARLGGCASVPTLLSVWGSDVYDFPRQGALARRTLLRNLAHADALASTSQAMARQVRKLWPAAPPIAITPFGVDMRAFAPQPAEAVPTSTSSPSSPCRDRDRDAVLTIGTVKTLAAKYGIDTLLHAFAALSAQRGEALPRLELLIVGDGPDAAALKRLADDLQLGQRVRWIGAVAHAEVPAWLRRLDIYVAASRLDSESFGVAVVEAMACAVPVVVSDAGGLPEVVGGDEGAARCGLVVPRDDPAALATALGTLIDDPALRARIAAAGRERALRHYAWEACVERMIAVQDAVTCRARSA